MKRTLLLFLAVILLGLAAWFSFISYINTRTTALIVTVSGAVDQVSIFRFDNPTNPVATIQTNGQKTIQTVHLPKTGGFSIFYQTPPLKYYFVAKKGNETYRGGVICCQTGLLANRIRLTISGLDQYEQTGG